MNSDVTLFQLEFRSHPSAEVLMEAGTMARISIFLVQIVSAREASSTPISAVPLATEQRCSFECQLIMKCTPNVAAAVRGLSDTLDVNESA